MRKTRRTIATILILALAIAIFTIFGPPPAELTSVDYAHTGRYDSAD